MTKHQRSRSKTIHYCGICDSFATSDQIDTKKGKKSCEKKPISEEYDCEILSALREIDTKLLPSLRPDGRLQVSAAGNSSDEMLAISKRSATDPTWKPYTPLRHLQQYGRLTVAAADHSCEESDVIIAQDPGL